MANDAVPTTSGPLALLSEIASRFARGGEVVATVTEVIDRLRSALDAGEVSLWLNSGGDLRRTVLSGHGTVTGDDLQRELALPGTHPGLLASPLISGGQRIGVLAIVRPVQMANDAAPLARIVANLLAPELAHAEDTHRLTGEVARSARQIEAERQFTAQIIDSLPVGLYAIDREYRVQAWNRNRETGYQGISREDAIGRSIFEVLHRQPADTLRAEFDEVFATGRIQQFNIESDASGSRRTFRITKIPMRLDGTAVTHVISIGEDITEWTAAQQLWAQSEKLAALGQLAAGVMHEINNPLATVAACAEGLSLRLADLAAAGCDVPPQAIEYTRVIDDEVQRCKRITDGLLTFSRPKSGDRAVAGLNDVIQQTLFLLKHHARFKRLQVRTLFDAAIRPMSVNSEQLIQVFMALLINAADASGEGGRITIRTRAGAEAAEGAIAEVIDEGVGIPRADLPRIFEPFYTTKPPGRGTGLGLSICYSIIADHRGRIEVDSAVGAGSTFRVILPVIEGDSGGTMGGTT